MQGAAFAVDFFFGAGLLVLLGSFVGAENLLMFVEAFAHPPAISLLEVCARDLGHFFFGFSILGW